MFIKPLDNFIITSPFGLRKDPFGQTMSFHNGLDLRAVENTPVKNIYPGTVKSVYFTPIGGLQIIIDHDNGFSSGFAHLNKVYFKSGDRLKQGEIFALTGNTGLTTAPHLHFRIKNSDDEYIDPSKIVYKSDQKTKIPYFLILTLVSGTIYYLYKD